MAPTRIISYTYIHVIEINKFNVNVQVMYINTVRTPCNFKSGTKWAEKLQKLKKLICPNA